MENHIFESVNQLYNYTCIFNSYVKLPEGNMTCIFLGVAEPQIRVRQVIGGKTQGNMCSWVSSET